MNQRQKKRKKAQRAYHNNPANVRVKTPEEKELQKISEELFIAELLEERKKQKDKNVTRVKRDLSERISKRDGGKTLKQIAREIKKENKKLNQLEDIQFNNWSDYHNYEDDNIESEPVK